MNTIIIYGGAVLILIGMSIGYALGIWRARKSFLKEVMDIDSEDPERYIFK